MNKPNIEDFLEICKLNIVEKYVSEIEHIIIESDCIYSSGINMPIQHILNIYTLRLKIAEENDKLSKDEIIDFKNCVKKIAKSNSEYIGIINLISEDYLYMVFYEPNDRKKIVGIIKFTNNDSIKTIEMQNDETKEKGYSLSYKKYSTGKLIKEW